MTSISLRHFCVTLIDWISDTHSQGCRDLQSLITCLDHGDIAAHYAVMQGRVRLRDALKCISEAIFTVMVSRTADLKAAEQYSERLLLTIRSRLTVVTAGNECKLNACRAEVVSVVIPISALLCCEGMLYAWQCPGMI